MKFWALWSQQWCFDHRALAHTQVPRRCAVATPSEAPARLRARFTTRPGAKFAAKLLLGWICMSAVSLALLLVIVFPYLKKKKKNCNP